MKHILTIAILVWGISSHAHWTRFHVEGCPAEDIALQVANKSNKPTYSWIVTGKNSRDILSKFMIEDIRKISGPEFMGSSELVEIYDKGDLKYILSCAGRELSSLPEASLHFQKFQSRDFAKIISLSPTPVRIENPFTKQTAELAKRGDTLEIKTAWLTHLKADGRISLIDKNVSAKWQRRMIKLSQVDPFASYFEVSNSKSSESFVIKLTDRTLIEKARNAIAEKKKLLVVADIRHGHGEFNRDFADSVKTPWSWHAEKVLDLNDFASIDCDGSPSLTERFFNEDEDTKRICFWQYYVTREVQISEVIGK